MIEFRIKRKALKDVQTQIYKIEQASISKQF